jgi:hypothetical protein
VASGARRDPCLNNPLRPVFVWQADTLFRLLDDAPFNLSLSGRRTFEIDVLACPDCGGRLRLLATIEDAAVVRKILCHLGLPSDCPQALPARSPPSSPELFDFQHD